MGVRRGSSVAILLPRAPDAYACILGVLKSGGAYVPIDPGYPSDRVSFILNDSGSAVLLTVSALARKASGFGGRVVCLDRERLTIASKKASRPSPEGMVPEDLCYVIYTSGSTGRPKGVQVEHRNAAALVEAESEVYRVVPEDRVCQCASLSFDLSVEEVWLALGSGATLVPAPPEASHGGPDFSSFVLRQGVTVLSTVPTLLSTLDDDLPTVRLLILGGETCPDWMADKWATKGRTMFNTYGPTETTVVATYAKVKPRRKVNIGIPLRGYYVRILDESLNLVPDGSPGEICVGGQGVARGYVNLPDETAARFVTDAHSDDPEARIYRTGDLGRVNSDGTLDFLGRADSQVKLRGFRVELTEVEEAMMQVGGVRSAACSVFEPVKGVQQLVGYVVMRRGGRVDERRFRSRLLETLPAHMVPSMIEQVGSLPLLPSGKLDRKALPPPRVPTKKRTSRDGPRTDTEKRILAVWSPLFEPQSVSVNDDFFLDLGGHSLLAARMVSQLRSDPVFTDVSIADVYENPSARSLARAVEARHVHLSQRVQPLPISELPVIVSSRPARHRLSAIAQVVGLYFSFGARAFEWVTPYLVFFLALASGLSLTVSLLYAVVAALLVFPILFASAVTAKWLLLGRIRPGRHPLWGGYYLRWWFVQSLVSAVPLDYLAGTPLLPAAFRLLGAKIGKNVVVQSRNIRAYDLVAIGDGSSIDEDVSLLGYTVEKGDLILGPIAVGKGCFVGARSVLAEWTRIGDGGRLEDLSLLPRGGIVPPRETWVGSPAKLDPQSKVVLPPRVQYGALRSVLTTVLYGALALSLPLLVLVALFPGVVVLFSMDPVSSPLLYAVAVPVVGAVFVFTVMSEYVLVKWLFVGRVRSGIYPVNSGFYIRNWVVDQMHSLTLDLVAPLHATQYLAPWYRALGAKVGDSVELSTATSTTPDLLELGDGATVADEVSLGSAHIEGGWMTLAPTVLGRRAFVGNSAVIPAGTVMGDGTLCGVLSIPPSDPASASRTSSAWLGSPPIELPHRQPSPEFTERRTFKPTKSMRLVRGAIESLRVTLVPAGFIAVTTSILGITTLLWASIGLVPALLLLPVTYGMVCGALALAGAAAKWTIIGKYKPFEQPLWTTFIWRLELVNAIYEFLVTPLYLEPLQGTPFLPAYERVMGSNVGRGVYLHTTGFLEWDLVEVGDGASLNEDCVLQTHLFEDRVLKASYLRVGVDCDVGAYSVVLYESEMEDRSNLSALSLLMKGERLPINTTWSGIPARRALDEIEVVEEID